MRYGHVSFGGGKFERHDEPSFRIASGQRSVASQGGFDRQAPLMEGAIKHLKAIEG